MMQIPVNSEYCNNPTYCPCLKNQTSNWCGVFGEGEDLKMKVPDGEKIPVWICRSDECKQKSPQITCVV